MSSSNKPTTSSSVLNPQRSAKWAFANMIRRSRSLAKNVVFGSSSNNRRNLPPGSFSAQESRCEHRRDVVFIHKKKRLRPSGSTQVSGSVSDPFRIYLGFCPPSPHGPSLSSSAPALSLLSARAPARGRFGGRPARDRGTAARDPFPRRADGERSLPRSDHALPRGEKGAWRRRH